MEWHFGTTTNERNLTRSVDRTEEKGVKGREGKLELEKDERYGGSAVGHSKYDLGLLFL
jgi:hypothetical protein